MHPRSVPDTQARRLALLLWLIYLGFVVYGSLIPFEIRPLSWEQAVSGFANIRWLDLGVVSRADWIANIVLYVPLAFAGCAAIIATARRASVVVPGMLLVAAISLALAVALEFAQQAFAPRTVSLNDLLAESIGILIGLSLWAFARDRISELARAIASPGRQSLLAALIAYGLAYLALALFPYDLILSGEELRWKLAGDNQGWLVAPACGGMLHCVARLTLDALAMAPLGLLAKLLWPRLALSRLLAIGIAAGLVLESAQLLLASGSSQGLSVLMRGLGLAGGALVGERLRVAGAQPVARLIGRAGPVLLLPYLAGVALLSGWLSRSPVTVAEAIDRLGDVRWLPFVYHYFSTEPVAMASTLANLALYAPFGLWAWARSADASARGRRHGGAGAAVLSAALAALVIEAGKLFFPPKHPDPTNLMIAMAGALTAYLLARWLARILGDSSGAEAPAAVAAPPQSRSPAAAPPGEVADTATRGEPVPEISTRSRTGEHAPVPWRPKPLGLALAGIAALATAAGLAAFPLAWPVLAACLVLYGVLLWRQPLAWLLMIPALLALLDLSPITGRLPLDAFDLCVLTTLAVGYARIWGVRRPRWPLVWLPLVLILVWVSWIAASARGLWPLLEMPWPPGDGSHSPIEAWMVGKGLLWALLLAPLLRRAAAIDAAESRRLLAIGTALGLAGVVMSVLWERALFVGLWSLDDPFRVTGTFASMATGGAYIEGFLVFAIASLAPVLAAGARPAMRLLAAALIAGGIYALYVTFARGGYLGLAAAMLVLAIGASRSPAIPARLRPWAGGALIAILLAGALGVLAGGTASERLKQSSADLAKRWAHWSHALGLLQSPGEHLLGAGFGQYPTLALLSGTFTPRPGGFLLAQRDGRGFLLLAAGQNLYLDQRVANQPGGRYELSISPMDGAGSDGLKVSLCEKALLYSFGCTAFPIADAGRQADWDGVLRASVQLESKRGAGAWPRRPLKLSLFNTSANPIELDSVSLRLDGRELLANGDFERGAERWLFSTDVKQPWHIDEIWVETWVAQGALGVLALVLLLAAAAMRLKSAFTRGDPWAVGLAAAVVGFLTVGLTGSLLDAAPTAMLLYLGIFAIIWLTDPVPKSRRRSRRRRGSKRNTRSEPTDVIGSRADIQQH